MITFSFCLCRKIRQNVITENINPCVLIKSLCLLPHHIQIKIVLFGRLTVSVQLRFLISFTMFVYFHEKEKSYSKINIVKRNESLMFVLHITITHVNIMEYSTHIRRRICKLYENVNVFVIYTYYVISLMNIYTIG